MILLRAISFMEMVSFSDYGDTMVRFRRWYGVGYRGRVCQGHPLSVGEGFTKICTQYRDSYLWVRVTALGSRRR